MKRLFISVFISVLLFVISSNAQMFEKFKVGEIWHEAISAGKEIYSNPKLIMVQTVNGMFNFGGMPVDVSFDINTGSSEVWMFLFVNADDTTKFINAFAAKHKSNGLMIFMIDSDNLNLSDIMSEYLSLPDDYAFDSDSLAAILRANQDFMDFYNKNKPFNNFNIMLYMNSKYDQLNIGNPYWFISIITSEINKGCAVQAITGEMFCEESGSYVSDNVFNSNDRYLLFPNPAIDVVYMNIPEPISNLRIMNIFGETVKEFSTSEINNFNSNQKLSFGTGEFANGVYFAIIDNRILRKFVVER